MGISNEGLALIQKYEGLLLKAYKDAVGVWTIGYGTTNSDRAITGVTIKSGTTITKATALKWLKQSIDKKYLPAVMKYDSIYHWGQYEIDALCSLAYNCGTNIISKITANGTRSRATIAAKFLEYNKVTLNGKKVALAGLTSRRKAERALFLKNSETVCPYATPTVNVTSKAIAASRRVKNYKSSGAEVRWVQWHLRKIGYDITIDGICGKQTTDAITLFQGNHNLTQDGICGRNTREILVMWSAHK